MVRILPKKTIIAAQERDTCEIPISLLRGHNETLKILDFVETAKLIEFRYAGEKIKAIVGGVVGHLPLTESVTLVIHPKFPISNMSRIVWILRAAGRLAPIERYYETVREKTYSLDFLVRSFVHYLKNFLVEGIHREYVRRDYIGSPRPHINFRRTEQLFWSKCIYTSAFVTGFEPTNDHLLNRILKVGVLLALYHARGRTDFKQEISILRICEDVLKNVSTIDRIPPRDRVRSQ